MGRMERLYKVDRMLRSGAPIPLRTIMEKLEVSRATVQRDLEYLRDRLGAPVVYRRHQPRGYTYDDSGATFRLPSGWIQEEDLRLVCKILPVLAASERGLLAPVADELHERITHICAAMQIEAPPRPRDAFVDGAAAAPTRTARVFRQLVRGFSLGRAVRLHLAADIGRDEAAVDVEPCTVVRYGRRWKLIFRGLVDRAFDAIPLIHVDRIEVLDTPVEDPEPAQLQAFLARRFNGVAIGAKGRAVLAVNPEGAWWVYQRAWPEGTRQRVLDDGTLQVDLPCPDPEALVAELMDGGPWVEVVRPTALRQSLADAHRQAAQRNS